MSGRKMYCATLPGSPISTRSSVGVQASLTLPSPLALAEGDRVAIRDAENLREGSNVKIMVSQSPQRIAAGDEG